MRKFFSLRGVFKTRNLVVMALMVALHIILRQLTSVYITPTFRALSFAYIPGVMVATLYGPWAGIAFGFVVDLVGFISKPVGFYFPGYAVSEMVINFIFAVALFEKPVTVKRAVLAQLAVVITVYFGLNFLWNVIMYGAVASKYFTGARLVSNLIQLPMHAALIAFFSRLAVQLERRAFAGR